MASLYSGAPVLFLPCSLVSTRIAKNMTLVAKWVSQDEIDELIAQYENSLTAPNGRRHFADYSAAVDLYRLGVGNARRAFCAPFCAAFGGFMAHIISGICVKVLTNAFVRVYTCNTAQREEFSCY